MVPNSNGNGAVNLERPCKVTPATQANNQSSTVDQCNHLYTYDTVVHQLQSAILRVKNRLEVPKKTLQNKYIFHDYTDAMLLFQGKEGLRRVNNPT